VGRNRLRHHLRHSVAARYDYVDDSGYTLLLLAEGGGSLALASFSTWYDEFLVEDDLTLAFDASTWGAIKSAVH